MNERIQDQHEMSLPPAPEDVAAVAPDWTSVQLGEQVADPLSDPGSGPVAPDPATESALTTSQSGDNSSDSPPSPEHHGPAGGIDPGAVAPAGAAGAEPPPSSGTGGHHPAHHQSQSPHVSHQGQDPADPDAAAAAGAAAATAVVLARMAATQDDAAAEPASDAAPDPDPEERAAAEAKALAGRVADRAATSILFSAGVVGLVVGFSLLICLTTAWMRGSAVVGFDLVGRSQNYSDAVSMAWPVVLATLPAYAIGAVSALFAIPVLRWVQQVPVQHRLARWGIVALPLLIGMPVRTSGLASFVGPGLLLPEGSAISGALTGFLWVSAGITVATVVLAVASAWTSSKLAWLLAAMAVPTWLSLDVAAPAILSRFDPFASLGPVIDTLMTLTGQLPLGASLTILSVLVLSVPLVFVSLVAYRVAGPPRARDVVPMSALAWVGVGVALVVAYLPYLVTLLVGLAEGARPWRLCAPPSGCSPIVTTALLLIPTALIGAALAAGGYYAGWLNPKYRRFGTHLAMMSGLVVPPTALGISLWLAATFLHLPVGLLTLLVGQVLVATGVSYAAVLLVESGQGPYEPRPGSSFALPRRAREAALYAGFLGAFLASAGFEMANQLSGRLRTVMTSAFAEAWNTGSVGDESLAAMVWALLTFPLFLFFLHKLLAMMPRSGDQEAPSQPEATSVVQPEAVAQASPAM